VVNHNFVVVEPMSERGGLPRPCIRLLTPLPSMVAKYPWNVRQHGYEVAGLSPASSYAGLEVVLCDTSIYQMLTGSRQGGKLDSPGALWKPKMVQSPHYKSCFICKTLRLFSF
jgi:hypothetical protein